MALVTLARAKSQLNIVSNENDEHIYAKVATASAIVLEYLKSRAVAGWSDGTVAVPGQVEEATLLLLTHLYENRGDDMKADRDAWDAIERLLKRSRDPALK